MTKFIELHEVSRTGERTKYLAATDLIRLVCDLKGPAFEPGDRPAGSNSILLFTSGTSSTVEETVDEVKHLLKSVELA